MSALTRLLGKFFGTTPTAPAPTPAPAKSVPTSSPTTSPAPSRSARWEASQSGPENRNHWANADDLGPNAAANAETRRLLRMRARYERDNDPYLCGLSKTLAYDLVGTGPRLQLTLGDEHDAAAKEVEQSYAAWCRAVGLTEKLRLMAEARPVDGESFALLTSNDNLPSPVKLDVRPFEADQCATPFPEFDALTDGIEYDRYGNPTFYHVLKQHPGDGVNWGSVGDYDRVAARFVLHWFRPSRPGQCRGVSEFAPSLPIGAQTRRWSMAVLGAAEFAASIVGVMETDGPTPDVDTPPAVENWTEVPLNRNALLNLPAGVKAKPFDGTQPIPEYQAFNDQKQNEKARSVMAPFNVISGNSSGYNYSSARLDHVPYHRFAWIERERFRGAVLDRIFLAWLQEAAVIGLIPDSLPPINLWAWEWQWDGFSSIDPLKDAQAVQLRLELNLTTLSEECASEGRNWRDVIDQRAVELAYMAAKGVGMPTAPAAPAAAADPLMDDEEVGGG